MFPEMPGVRAQTDAPSIRSRMNGAVHKILGDFPGAATTDVIVSSATNAVKSFVEMTEVSASTGACVDLGQHERQTPLERQGIPGASLSASMAAFIYNLTPILIDTYYTYNSFGNSCSYIPTAPIRSSSSFSACFARLKSKLRRRRGHPVCAFHAER
jgi:hypothetical protein